MIQTCACGCGRTWEFYKTPRPKRYFNHRCSGKMWDKNHPENVRARRNRLKRKALGRVCKWCKLSDADVPWTLSRDECSACQRQRQRRACQTCGGPRHTREIAYCPRCDAPEGSVEVVVLDESHDRERVVRRLVRQPKWGAPYVSVSGRKVYLRDGDDEAIVVELPTKKWLRTRT